MTPDFASFLQFYEVTVFLRKNRVTEVLKLLILKLSLRVLLPFYLVEVSPDFGFFSKTVTIGLRGLLPG